MSRPAKAQSHHLAGSRTHGEGVLREQRHDAYRSDEKPVSGTTCPDCAAQVQKGRWVWPADTAGRASSEVDQESLPPLKRCPACARMHAQDPAGELILSGAYVGRHEAELRSLLAHEAHREASLHPLERVMSIDPMPGGSLKITTTGLHLPRMLAHALERAHHGTLHTTYAPDQSLVRISWHREV
jgi:hypothetical protein